MKDQVVNFRNIPHPVKEFLVKAIVIFITWNSLYIFILRPAQIPDRSLTVLTTKFSVGFLNVFSSNTYTYQYTDDGPIIISENVSLVKVKHACNALELYILFISFLFCLPSKRKKMFAFAAVGIASVFMLNVLRIAGVTWMNEVHSEWTEFNHKYLFKGVVYSAILFLWFKYAEKSPNPKI